MAKADRAAKDKNHAAYMKKMRIQRAQFRCICGHLIGIGQVYVQAHFASGKCR